MGKGNSPNLDETEGEPFLITPEAQSSEKRTLATEKLGETEGFHISVLGVFNLNHL